MGVRDGLGRRVMTVIRYALRAIVLGSPMMGRVSSPRPGIAFLFTIVPDNS